MGRASRDKGARGELEVLQLVRDAGWTRATRNFASGAVGNGDLAHGPAGVVFEVKRTERLDLPGAYRQAVEAAGPHDLPVVAHRRSRDPWLATLPLDELLALLRLRECG